MRQVTLTCPRCHDYILFTTGDTNQAMNVTCRCGARLTVTKDKPKGAWRESCSIRYEAGTPEDDHEPEDRPKMDGHRIRFPRVGRRNSIFQE